MSVDLREGSLATRAERKSLATRAEQYAGLIGRLSAILEDTVHDAESRLRMDGVEFDKDAFSRIRRRCKRAILLCEAEFPRAVK